MAENDHVAAHVRRVRPDEYRSILFTFADCFQELAELLIVRRKPVLNEGGVDEVRVQVDDCFALNELVGARCHLVNRTQDRPRGAFHGVVDRRLRLARLATIIE